MRRLFALFLVVALVVTSSLPGLPVLSGGAGELGSRGAGENQSSPLLASLSAPLRLGPLAPLLPSTSPPQLSSGLYRTRITVRGPADWARLKNLGVVVLEQGDNWALVLADDDQLETLARLRFEPQSTDELGMLVAAHAQAKPWLAASWAEVQRSRGAEEKLSPLLLRSLAPLLTSALTSVDDDADGLTNTQEAWWGTDPMNPDSDGDGVTDGAEVAALKDWMANRRNSYPASGRPFLGWPDETHDSDHDSVPDLAERWELGLNMNRESTDRDKFDDGQELFGLTKWGWGALPRAEDTGYIFAEMPSWVKAPGNHPLVAAYPEPKVEVSQSSLVVQAVTVVTTNRTVEQNEQHSYSTSIMTGTSTSIADTTTWNNWEEVSVTSPVLQASGLDVQVLAQKSGLEKFIGKATKQLVKAVNIGERVLDVAQMPIKAFEIGTQYGEGINRAIYTGYRMYDDVRSGRGMHWPKEYLDEYETLEQNKNRCTGGCGAGTTATSGGAGVGFQDGAGQNYATGRGGRSIAIGSDDVTVQRFYPMSFMAPAQLPTKTETNGHSWGGAQTTTNTEYQEHTITNGKIFGTTEGWGTATAVDSAHSADLWFTYKVRNTGTEYAREIANLAFNIYIGDNPNPAYTYFVAPDLGGDGKFHNFMPGEEHTYTSHHIPLTLQQMAAVDLGGPVRIVVEDFTYGIDELFYQDAVNAGVLIAIEDGTDDGDELIDTYLIPTWGTETVLDVLARYFPHTTDADGNLIAIWTPEYRSDTPSWCQEGYRTGNTLWCQHALSTADWWNVYTDGLGDGSEGFQDTPAAPGSVALFRFNQDSDLDGYSDRSERQLGTDPYDSTDYPKPELIAGLHSIRSGNNVIATLSLLNTGLYDAYGVEAVMIAPDDSVSITNNTVGGSGRVRAQKQVIVGSRILPPSYTSSTWRGTAKPASGGYYTGQQDRTYTFTVSNCSNPLGCDVSAGTWSLAWNDGAGASGTLNFGAGYKSPNLLDVGTLGVKLSLLTGKVYSNETFTVEARTPSDTFQYTINREPYTEPVVIVSYNDPQGNHRFVTPVHLSSPTENLAPHSGKMLHGDADIEIVTQSPFDPAQANTTTLIAQSPVSTRLVDAHLFLEFIDPEGTVVREEAKTVTLETGPNVVDITWNSADFNPAYDPNQDYIVMAFFTDWQGNILDTAARPLSSFQADPKPALALDETGTTWDFGSVPQGTLLEHTFTLANTGMMNLKATVVGTGVRTDQNVPGNPAWTDTGLDVAAGDAIGVRASGTVCYANSGTTLCYGPDGNGVAAPEGWALPGVSQVSLIAKIGSGTPFFVGSTYVNTASSSGRLYLGTNDCGGCYHDNGGNYQAHIEIQGLPTSFQGRPSFSIDPADATKLDVTLDTYYLPAGPFNRTILVRTSDPAHSTQTFRVQCTVAPYVAPARSMAVSPYRPWDQRVAVSGDRSYREVVTFDDTIAADAADVHPLRVYNDTRQTALGAGREVARAVANEGMAAASVEGATATTQEQAHNAVSRQDVAHAVTSLVASSTPSVFGDGRDGDLTVGSGQSYSLDLTRTAVFGAGSQGQVVLPVASTSAFNVGDEVLIHQSRGTGAGTYEFNTIVAKDTGTLMLQKPLTAGYKGDAFQNLDCPNGTGMRGEYFNNNGWSGSPVFVRCDQWIRFSWWGGGPGNGVPNDYFSVRWTGNIFIPTAGNYTFSAEADDRVHLYIDGVHVVTNGSVTRNLSAGAHSIRIDYAEDGGRAWVNFVPPFRDDRAQVIKVPQYQSVTIPSGSTLTTPGWDRSTGGILVMRVKDTITINGTISLNGGNGDTTSGEYSPAGGSGAGYHGGTGDAVNNDNYGQGYQGEGTGGLGTWSQSANGNGGGAGPGSPQTGNFGTGGGGGNGSPGSNSTSGGIGYGGQTAGNPELTNIVFGGGGGGSNDNPGNSIGGGGAGGGIIIISGRNISVNGPVMANGGQGGGDKWGGGSGAGGSILIKGQTIGLGSNLLTAVGGAGRNGGGNGGSGRIRVEYCDTFSGSTNPPASVAKINFCYGTVSGKVFSDDNSNGVQDAGEPGLAGVTVNLSGVGQTTTGGDGSYSFTANAPANYTVSVTPPAGYDCVTPCSVNVALQVDQTTTVNFALRPRASISGKVFHDTNNNGVQDAGESGIGGVIVTLNTGPSRTTAGDGSYSFADLTPDNYSVSVTVPDGHVDTTSTTVSCNLSAGSTCTANFGILMYTIEKVAGSEHQIRLFLPESFRSGRRYWAQYGRSMTFSGSGEAVAQVKLPKVHYGTATMDVLLTQAGNSFVQINLDVGNNGTWEWGYNGSPAIPTTLPTNDLAAALNAFMNGATPDADGLVTVPLRVSLNTSGRLYLTNLVATPDGISDVSISPADVTLNPTNPVEGDTVNVQATLHNTSSYDSGGLTVSFFATPTVGSSYYIGSAFVPNIPAGGTAQASIQWNTLGFTGTVPVRVLADPYNRVAETNEDNNQATASLTIKTRPDLYVPAINLSDDEPVTGQPVTVRVPLHNSGQTAAGASTLALYDGNPDSGGLLLGEGTAAVPGGGETALDFTWTPTAPGSHRLFAISDRNNVVNEFDEGNNQTWQDVYVGFAGPLLLDSGAATDPVYTTTLGYGFVDEGQADVIATCGTGSRPEETLRRDPGGRVVYRFDHLLPGHFYHLDVTLYECDGAGRQESVYVDGNLVAGPEDLGDGQVHRLSLRLDPALYADHVVNVTVEAPGIDGAVVNEINLHDIDYRYADAGGANDPQYPGAQGYGWLDGVANTAWGTLPYKSVRVEQSDNELRYRFDGLNLTKKYNVHLTFWQGSGTTTRIQKVQIDGVDTGTTVNVSTGVRQDVNVDVLLTAYQSDGSIIVGIVRTNASIGAMVNEIALEEETSSVSAGCVAPVTPSFTEVYGSLTINGAPAPAGTVVQAISPRGDTVGCFTVAAAGQYGLMRIYGEDPTANPPIPGMRDGELVVFRVNGASAVATPLFYWHDDKASHRVDLVPIVGPGQPILLAPGWNLISFRVEPPAPLVNQVLSNLGNRYDRVLGETGVYSPTLPDVYNTLKELHSKQGYYLRLTGSTSANLLVEGLPVAANSPIALHKGWNWIGYLPQATLPVTQALQSIAGLYQRVLSLDKTYDPSLPEFSTLKEMRPGEGYLIYMNQAATLTYPAGGGAGGPGSRGAEEAIELGCPGQPTPYATLVYGTLSLNGAPAPAGTRVEVVTSRGEVAGCFVVVRAGQYGLMHVYGADNTAQPPIGGFQEGEPLRFRVNGIPASTSIAPSWQDDKAPHRVDLNVGLYPLYLPLILKSR